MITGRAASNPTELNISGRNPVLNTHFEGYKIPIPRDVQYPSYKLNICGGNIRMDTKPGNRQDRVSLRKSYDEWARIRSTGGV